MAQHAIQHVDKLRELQKNLQQNLITTKEHTDKIGLRDQPLRGETRSTYYAFPERTPTSYYLSGNDDYTQSTDIKEGIIKPRHMLKFAADKYERTAEKKKHAFGYLRRGSKSPERKVKMMKTIYWSIIQCRTVGCGRHLHTHRGGNATWRFFKMCHGKTLLSWDVNKQENC